MQFPSSTDLTILICVLKTILNPAIPLIVLDYTLKKYLIFLKLIFLKQTLVIEKLKEQKKLLKDDKLNHSYPHSWRSKAPLIYRATHNGFISMEKNSLRNKAIKAINDTKFFPEKGKERLLSMIEGRPDWCVSRQRVGSSFTDLY